MTNLKTEDIEKLLPIMIWGIIVVLIPLILLLLIQRNRYKREARERFGSIYYSTAFALLEPHQKETITQIAKSRGITIDTYIVNLILRDLEMNFANQSRNNW